MRVPVAVEVLDRQPPCKCRDPERDRQRSPNRGEQEKGSEEKPKRAGLPKTWKVEETKWGVKEGMTDLVKVADFVPADVKAKVDAARLLSVYDAAHPRAKKRTP